MAGIYGRDVYVNDTYAGLFSAAPSELVGTATACWSRPLRPGGPSTGRRTTSGRSRSHRAQGQRAGDKGAERTARQLRGHRLPRPPGAADRREGGRRPPAGGRRPRRAVARRELAGPDGPADHRAAGAGLGRRSDRGDRAGVGAGDGRAGPGVRRDGRRGVSGRRAPTHGSKPTARGCGSCSRTCSGTPSTTADRTWR